MAEGRENELGRGPWSDEDARADDLLRAAPALARIAAVAGVRSVQWAAGAYVDGVRRVTRAAISGESPVAFFEETAAGLRDQARRLLGVDEIEDRLEVVAPEPVHDGKVEVEPLREVGAALLARSADIDRDEGAHPAYGRILAQLTPDEARILRLLVTRGPQAAVDVRTWRPFGIASKVVAPGLSMIAAEAGCRKPEEVPAYLNNLFRLGLIWFSREPVDDLSPYQVLEAQPEVADAMREAGRGTTVRRSIHLTPFGTDFCETCLPVDTGEFEALGEQEKAPPETSEESATTEMP
jgi:hypothetical protein